MPSPTATPTSRSCWRTDTDGRARDVADRLCTLVGVSPPRVGRSGAVRAWAQERRPMRRNVGGHGNRGARAVSRRDRSAVALHLRKVGGKRLAPTARLVAVAVAAALLAPAVARPHGGGLDALGCHHDRKAGGHHCLRGPLAGRFFGSKAEAVAALGRDAAQGDGSGQPPVRQPSPSRRSEAPSGSAAGNPSARVWVNTNSGVYHCPGTRWYGATKEGTYMTQAEAQKRGHRPGHGKLCW